MKSDGGPISVFLEGAATSVGVGMMLGGFFAGLVGLLRRVPRADLEPQVLNVGYLFAGLCLLLRLAEMTGTI